MNAGIVGFAFQNLTEALGQQRFAEACSDALTQKAQRAVWDADGPTFREALGDAAIYFDLNFGRTAAGLEAAEQFSSDAFHFLTTHASAVSLLSPRDVPPPTSAPLPGRQFAGSQGHGGGFFVGLDTNPGPMITATGHELFKYIMEVEQPQAIARFGEIGASYPIFANFFPTMGYLHA